jgi:hypothetical protein
MTKRQKQQGFSLPVYEKTFAYFIKKEGYNQYYALFILLVIMIL